MPNDNSWWRRALMRLRTPVHTLAPRDGRIDRVRGLSSKTASRRFDSWDAEWTFAGGSATERSFAIRLHRFLRDHVPILKSVVWTWTRMAVSPHRFEVAGDVSESTRARVQEVLDALDRRIFPERIVRFGGFDALLVQFFDTLFTDGSVAGELTVLPSHNGLDRFDFIDSTSLEFEPDRTGHWQLWQRDAEQRIALNSDAIF